MIFPDELLPEIAEAAPVPIYSSLDTYIGKGVVGGMMRSEISIATRVGEVTLRILEGAKPEDIPIEAARMSPIFDWRQVQRWGIDRRCCRSPVSSCFASQASGIATVVTSSVQWPC